MSGVTGGARSTEVHVTLTESENQPGLVSGQTGGPASTHRERERERERLGLTAS